MGIQSAGRAQMKKMRRIARPGTKAVTFRLFEDDIYDPDTGTLQSVPTEITIDVFASRGTTSETKSGSVTTTEYALIFEEGLLPRTPMTQDEVVMDGLLYKVTDSGGDPVGGVLKICVALA